MTTPMKKAAARVRRDEWEKVVLRGGRANHSVANAGNPSQGQDQSVNPVQSAEGLAPCTTNDSASPLLRTFVYIVISRRDKH